MNLETGFNTETKRIYREISTRPILNIKQLLSSPNNLTVSGVWSGDVIHIIDADLKPVSIQHAWENVLVNFPEIAHIAGLDSPTVVHHFNILKANNLISPVGDVHFVLDKLLKEQFNAFIKEQTQ